jgi:hypothetical protein
MEETVGFKGIDLFLCQTGRRHVVVPPKSLSAIQHQFIEA